MIYGLYLKQATFKMIILVKDDFRKDKAKQLFGRNIFGGAITLNEEN